MKKLLLISFVLVCSSAASQSYEYVYRDPGDSAVNCYLKVIPDSKPVKGLIVRDYSALPDTSKPGPFRFLTLATENGMMTLYAVTSKTFPELFYDDSCTALLDEIIHEVVTAHNVPRENVFVGGMSASGTRALRYAQYCVQGKSKYGSRVRAVFAADSPLDIERFYYSARNNHDNLKAGMLWEADVVTKVFPEVLGGTPDEKPGAYREASVFSQSDPAGGNAVYYKDVSMILFHEPDMTWWTPERGATYYDINSYDISGFVKKVKELGNKDVEEVVTTGKGFDRQGERNCHSWTIVDEDYLMKWIMNRVK